MTATGSFTRAADAAGTTQSAISLKLKRLESRLGYRLIERTPRWVTLTGHDAALAPCMLPLGAIGVGRKLRLPELPSLPIMLHSNAKHEHTRAVVNELAATFGSKIKC